MALGACADSARVTDLDETTDPSARRAANARPGAVYVQTNSRGSNHVVVYGRAADGTLKRRGTFRRFLCCESPRSVGMPVSPR